MQYNQRKIATLAISERTKKKLFISPGFCTETPNHKIIGIKWIHIYLSTDEKEETKVCWNF